MNSECVAGDTHPASAPVALAAATCFRNLRRVNGWCIVSLQAIPDFEVELKHRQSDSEITWQARTLNQFDDIGLVFVTFQRRTDKAVELQRNQLLDCRDLW